MLENSRQRKLTKSKSRRCLSEQEIALTKSEGIQDEVRRGRERSRDVQVDRAAEALFETG